MHYFSSFFFPPKNSTVEEKGKRMLPEFISSWKDGTDVGGKTETAFLLKELDTLRAKNKKVKLRYSDHRICWFMVVLQNIYFKLFLI